MIRTSGGTLIFRVREKLGCLFDLVCLPARTKIWYIYIITYTYITYIYTHMRDYIWYIYIYIWGIWMYLSFVTVCVMSSMQPPGSREPRCWPEACPTANRWSSNCAATSTWHDGGIFSRSWRMMMIEKTTVVRWCMRVLVECGAYESILRISMSIIVMTAMLFVLCGCAVVFQVCVVYGGCMFIHLVWV